MSEFIVVRFQIKKDEGKYAKAIEADFRTWSNQLALYGKRLTLRGSFAYYHVKTFSDIKTEKDAERKLKELGFKIISKEKFDLYPTLYYPNTQGEERGWMRC